MEEVSGKLENLRVSTQIEREAENILQAEGLTPENPIIAEKCGHTSNTGNIPLSTNVYGLLMAQAPVYRYDVVIKAAYTSKIDGSVKWIDFTKKSKGDAVIIDRRDRCRDVFVVLQKNKPAFMKSTRFLYFDLQSIIYSLDQLDVPQGSEGIKYDIPSNQLPPNFSMFTLCQINICRVNKDFQLALGDLSCLSRNLTLVEHSLAQFLDLATSQKIMFSPNEHITLSSNTSFLLNPTDHGFKDSDMAFFEDNGSYLAIGANKSVRFIEGPTGEKNSALIVGIKKTPFHIVEPLLEKASRIVRNLNSLNSNEFNKLEIALSGLFVETTHLNRTQRFIVKGLEIENAKSKTFVLNDQTISVNEYFREKHKIVLKAPLAPLVRARGKDNKICYVPMELCTVVDNQQLKIHQQTPRQIQETIKRCAISPFVLRQQNQKIFNSLHLNDKNPYLTNAKIRVIENPLSLKARLINPPDLQYGGNNVTKVRTDNFTWQGRRFLIPAACNKWGSFALVGQYDRFNEKDLLKFTERFIAEANNKGMQMSQPSIVYTTDIKNLKSIFEEASKRKFQFILAVHPDTADDIHHNLKLYERQHQIVTQAIRLGTFNNIIIKGQPMTLSNIVFKTNIKLGGLNYSISINSSGAKDVLKSSTLFIGISTNHPAGGKFDSIKENSSKFLPPSVVGYSANYGLVDEFEFIGDFLYQEARREEKVEVIRQIIDRCLTKYIENRKTKPNHILLYRNGCSEGQFSMVLKYEVPLIKLTLKKLKCNAHLNIIVPNKLQNIRFFPKEINPQSRASDQNIKPGTVVDHSVVHPEFAEFFLNSHRALQGTARTPKYTLLLNESKYTMEQLESITYVLCYGHQIVQLTTSLPSPVYIAGRYAERGRKLFSSLPNSNTTPEFEYEKFNEKLGYYGTSLDNVRVNA